MQPKRPDLLKLVHNHIAWHVRIHQNHPDLPYLVLIHGFMGCGRVFHPLFERLGTFCNPVTIDLIGHGESEGSSEPSRYRTEALIQDLASLLSRLRLTPFYLYGYSMGGRLVLQYAVAMVEVMQSVADPDKSPEDTHLKSKLLRSPGEGSDWTHPPDLIPAGILLESTHPGFVEEEARRNRQELDRRRATELREDLDGFLQRWHKLPLFTAARDVAQPLPGQAYDTYLEGVQNPDWLAACQIGFGTGSMPPVLNRLDHVPWPALLLSGRRDEKFVDLHLQMSQKLPRAVHRIMEGAAHRVHLDQPVRLVQELENFIRTSTINSTEP